MDEYIPCDYCLETFENLQDFNSHMHRLDPSFCILCYEQFPPGTRRHDFEEHINKKCNSYNRLNFKLYNLTIPIAKNMKLSTNNNQTKFWIYVKGKRCFLERDDRLLSKSEEERKFLLYFSNNHIPKIQPFEDSPIIHYSSSLTMVITHINK